VKLGKCRKNNNDGNQVNNNEKDQNLIIKLVEFMFELLSHIKQGKGDKFLSSYPFEILEKEFGINTAKIEQIQNT
jgi:hypothetical protein